MTDDTRTDPRRRLEIDWVKTAAGALAAVSSAVVLSRIGAAGTIIGAALGSVVVTVANAFYSQGLERSRDRIAQAHAQAVARVGAAQAEVRRASRRQAHGGRAPDPAARSELQHAEEHLADAQRDLDQVSADASGTRGAVSWRDRLAGLPWRRIALLAAALFVVAVVLITAFELVSGRSVSSYTGGTHGSGGTSLSHLTGSGGGSGHTPAPSPSPSTTPTEGATLSAQPTPSEATPSAPANPTPTAPSVSPTPATPSASPTESQAPVVPPTDVPTP
jgi:hypothetical protein